MAWRHLQLLIIVLKLSAWAVKAEVVTITGGISNDTNNVACLPVGEISEIDLKCTSEQEIIHIIDLELSHVNDCSQPEGAGVCKLTPDWHVPNIVIECEGRQGSCRFHLLNQTDCGLINHINITIRCVNPNLVEPLCPEIGYILPNRSESVILATDNFVRSNSTPERQYTSESQCRCVATPTSGSIIYVQLLYIRLEAVVEGPCLYDWLTIDGQRYCGFDDLVVGNDDLHNSRPGRPIVFQFRANAKVDWGGAWFSISTDTNKTFELKCNAVKELSNETTPIFITTTPTTTSTSGITTSTTTTSSTTSTTITTTVSSTTISGSDTTSSTLTIPPVTSPSTVTTSEIEETTSLSTTSTGYSASTASSSSSPQTKAATAGSKKSATQKPLGEGIGIGIGIGVGVFLLIALIGLVIVCCYRSKPRTMRRAKNAPLSIHHERFFNDLEKYAASQQTEPLPDVVGPSVRLSPNTMAAHFARRQHGSSQTRQEDEFMTSAAQFSRQLSREPIMRQEMNRNLENSYMQRQERY